MGVYTKTGDFGETGLFGGSRVSKLDPRVNCYGTADELNAHIGHGYALVECPKIRKVLRQLQTDLFVLCAQLASDETGKASLAETISTNHVAYVERKIDRYQQLIGEQHSFVYPGGTVASSALHLARTVARRLERCLYGLAENYPVERPLLVYVNRLSDLLFVLAIAAEQYELTQEVKKQTLALLGAQKLMNQNPKLAMWLKAAKAAEEKAAEMGIPFSFAAVDEGGNLALFHRMDDTLLVSTDIAINKAYTAVALKMPTHEVYPLAQPGGALYGINTTNDCKLVTFGGGFPVVQDGKLIGAIGVSGGSVEEDMVVAKAALAAIV